MEALKQWAPDARLKAKDVTETGSCVVGSADSGAAWTRHRVSNGAVEGMNNKIRSISHRSFGFRTAENFIAAIYHCCAKLPLPLER